MSLGRSELETNTRGQPSQSLFESAGTPNQSIACPETNPEPVGRIEHERGLWFGDEELLPIQINDFETPRISPDGQRLVYQDFDRQGAAIYDISTGSTHYLGEYTSFVWSWDRSGVSVTPFAPAAFLSEAKALFKPK